MFYCTVVYIYEIPYNGFSVNDRGEITRVFITAALPNNLEEGDLLIKIDGANFEDSLPTSENTLWSHHTPGDQIKLTISRSREESEINWTFPEPNQEEILDRIYASTFLLLPYLFWLAGTLTLITIRPRDLRWTLLTALNFNTAISVITGYISAWNVRASRDVFHFFLWLGVALAWQLNW